MLEIEGLDVWWNFNTEYRDIPSSRGLQIDAKFSLAKHIPAQHKILD